MPDNLTQIYAQRLATLVRCETVSTQNQIDKSKFYAFHNLLRQMFPKLFATCHFEDFNGSILLRWKGASAQGPILLMNHHDVVEAQGNWKYPPFSGTIAEGKLWAPRAAFGP